MCLIIDKKQCPKGYKIAKKNIPCYKVLLQRYDSKFETPYMREPIIKELGIIAKRFQTEPTVACIDTATYKTIAKVRIDEGVHSYTNLESAHRAKNSWYSCVNVFVYPSIVVLKGYIPKGTKYWVGEYHEFCSERIVFTEK